MSIFATLIWHPVFAETLSGIVSVSFNPDGSLLATGDGQDLPVASGRWSTGFDMKGHAGWIWPSPSVPTAKR